MSPDELPQQKVYEVVDLPKPPPEFEASCLMQYGYQNDRNDFEWSIPEDDLPQRFPGTATFVAQVEWAWAPHHDRVDSYYICSNRRRTHWFLWLRFPDENTWENRMESILYAYCPRRKVDQKTAAIHLLLHAWRYEAAKSNTGRFDWINDAGLLTVSEIHAIVRAVWEKQDSCGKQITNTDEIRNEY